jgi:hypothetical protein
MGINDKVNFTDEELDRISKNLLDKKDRLIEEINAKYSVTCQWLSDHNINLNDLSRYSKQLAAVAGLTGQLVLNNPQPTPVPTPPTNQPVQLDNTNRQNINSSDKINRVWTKYGNFIRSAANKYNVDEQLILATIMAESEGNQFAFRAEPRINDASYGLGQILFSTARGLGFAGTTQDLYDPEINIDLIAKYHRRTIDTYGLLTPDKLALVYNTGRLFSLGYPGYLIKFSKWYDLTDQVYI